MIGGVVRLFGMKLNLLTRRTHYWATALIAVPFALVLLTGILLQLKKQLPWVQPAEMRGGKSLNWVGFQEVLGALKSRPELGIQDWRDVQRLDIRPSKGIAKAILDSGWEVQVDLENGQVLQQAIRRSDWIESLHDGSYFAGNWSKIGVFLPIAFVVLAMWITGIWMFWLPFAVKLRRKRVAAARTKPIAIIWGFLAASLGAPSLETTLFASQPFTSQPNQAQPYNVVFILADDLGWAELGSYGQKKIPTPHLDRLSSEGIRFTEHYSGAPVCAPSRCVLMTGKHLGHAEIRGNLQAKVNFPDFSEGQHPISSQAFTLAEMFQRAGYKTGRLENGGSDLLAVLGIRRNKVSSNSLDTIVKPSRIVITPDFFGAIESLLRSIRSRFQGMRSLRKVRSRRSAGSASPMRPIGFFRRQKRSSTRMQTKRSFCTCPLSSLTSQCILRFPNSVRFLSRGMMCRTEEGMDTCPTHAREPPMPR